VGPAHSDGVTVEDGRRQLLGRLLPSALHELSNPLLALGGTTELLLEDAEPGTDMHRRLSLVQRTAAEISELVRLLQRLARERVEPARELDLDAFVRDTAEIAVRFGEIKGVGVDVRGASAGRLVAEPAVVRQLLLAVLLDAVDAADSERTVVVAVVDGALAISPGAGGGAAATTAAAALGARLDVDPAEGTRIRFALP